MGKVSCSEGLRRADDPLGAATLAARMIGSESLINSPCGDNRLPAAAAVAAHLEVPVWLVAGTGHLLPGSMFGALVDRWSSTADPLDATEEVMALSLVDRVAGVAGVDAVPTALAHTDCPVAPELFRLAG